MKILVQRTGPAHVEVEGEIVGAIQSGVLVFVGITHKDTIGQAVWLANKLVHLRIFEDDAGKLNCSLLENKSQALIISQFTLYADCTKGRRPSFIEAAPSEIAKPLYELFCKEVEKQGVSVARGVFGAKMEVSLVNQGPLTFILES